MTQPLVIVGDSFAAGFGASDPAAGYAQRLARHLGQPVDVVAAGGCGFVNRGPHHGLRGSHLRRVRRVPRARSLLILQASGNDRWTSADEITEAMHTFMRRVRGDSPVLVVGPMWAGNHRELLPLVVDGTRRFADETGHPYIDAGDWFGDGAGLLAPDGGHPNDVGHALIAERLLPHVRPLVSA